MFEDSMCHFTKEQISLLEMAKKNAEERIAYLEGVIPLYEMGVVDLPHINEWGENTRVCANTMMNKIAREYKDQIKSLKTIFNLE